MAGRWQLTKLNIEVRPRLGKLQSETAPRKHNYQISQWKADNNDSKQNKELGI